MANYSLVIKQVNKPVNITKFINALGYSKAKSVITTKILQVVCLIEVCTLELPIFPITKLFWRPLGGVL